MAITGKVYQIWDGVSNVFTPSGDMFTPEQWKEQYKWLNNPNTCAIITAGTINGGVCEEYFNYVNIKRNEGCDLPDEILDDRQEVINRIEAHEEAMREAAAEYAMIPTAEERIAAVMEAEQMDKMIAEMEE